MKRTQLIEWGIIITGLILGYKFFVSLFNLLLQIAYEFGEDGLGRLIIRLVILTAIYAAGFVLLIRNSSQIAGWVNGPAENDTIPIKINKRPLLHVILIAICLVTILSNIAQIVLYLFEAFKQEVGRRHEPADNFVSNYRFKLAAIETIIALVILYFSKDISGWFIRKNEADELTFESEPEKDK